MEKIIEFIIGDNNYQWIFSGVGNHVIEIMTTLIIGVGSLFCYKKTRKDITKEEYSFFSKIKSIFGDVNVRDNQVIISKDEVAKKKEVEFILKKTVNEINNHQANSIVKNIVDNYSSYKKGLSYNQIEIIKAIILSLASSKDDVKVEYIEKIAKNVHIVSINDEELYNYKNIIEKISGEQARLIAERTYKDKSFKKIAFMNYNYDPPKSTSYITKEGKGILTASVTIRAVEDGVNDEGYLFTETSAKFYNTFNFLLKNNLISLEEEGIKTKKNSKTN